MSTFSLLTTALLFVILLFIVSIIFKILASKIVGIFVFVLLIVWLYKIPSKFCDSKGVNHYRTTMVVIDCKTKHLQFFSIKNPKIKVAQDEYIKTEMDLDKLNEFQKVVLLNPKHGYFQVDTFDITEIDFISNTEYKDGHLDLILKWK